MTPQLAIRTFSNDQYILDKIVYANWYRLRGFKENKPTILDIGAHAGYFCFSAFALGAKKVFAFEPFVENYKILLQNMMEKTPNEFISYQMGIYPTSTRLTFGYPSIKKSSYLDFADIGEHSNLDNQTIAAAPAISLDEALTDYVSESIDILKINIGYGEVDILLASEKVATVTHICGEANLSDSSKAVFQTKMGAKGFTQAKFIPVPDVDGRMLFHFSRANLADVFESETEG